VKTLVLANQKGGVGKSAIATLLVHYLAQDGKRTLAIDLDHQGNLTRPLSLSGRATVACITSDALLATATASVPGAGLVLVSSDRALLALERQPTLHTPFARNLRAFLKRVDAEFDVCVIDTNPNPDIRVIASLASADFVLSPIQLTQEAMVGVSGLLNHDRVGVRKIKTLLNPKLELVGLLPSMVESVPFQRANFVQVAERYASLLIPLGGNATRFALIPRRSSIAEAQATGDVLWEMKKTAAIDTWKEIRPGIRRIADIVSAEDAVRGNARP
jgi:chromosome partitioning protein